MNKRFLQNITKLNHTTIGFEIECTGITRYALAEKLAELWGTIPKHNDDEGYSVKDHKGRTWELVPDRSILALDFKHEVSNAAIDDIYKVELVSPPLYYYELLTDYKPLFDLLEKEKIVSNAEQNCGVHIHIGTKDTHSPASLRNLLALSLGKDEIFNKYIVKVGDRIAYCRATSSVSPNFTTHLFTRLNTQKVTSDLELAALWYDSYEHRPVKNMMLEADLAEYKKDKQNSSRYTWLNLHSYFYRGTVEFRGWNFKEFINFNELKAFLQICLAMSYYAINAKSVKPTLDTIEKANLRYQMHTWGNRIGLIGEEFKDARELIRQNLPGDIAFNSGVRPSRSAV